MESFAQPQFNTESQKYLYVSRALVQEEFPLAQRLVYQVFVDEIGWIPELSNPSGIRFEIWKNSPIFVDNYDSVAQWFGTFHHDRLIACWRFCKPLDDRFELERYHPIPDSLKQSSSLEVTRLVIHPCYRHTSRILLHLARSTYQELWKSFDNVFTAVAFPNPGNLYLKLGAKKLDLPPFKYLSSDLSEVSLITLDLKDKRTLVSGHSNNDKFDRSLII